MDQATEPAALLAGYDDGVSRVCLAIRAAGLAIGRGSSNDVIITDDPLISRQHCRLEAAEGGVWLIDQDSTNGTFLHGHRVSGRVSLTPPDWFLAGRTRLIVLPTHRSHDAIDEASLFGGHDSILVPSRRCLTPRTEAMMVVDLAASSALVRRDDVTFAQLVSLLGQVLVRAMRSDEHGFLKGTGDGFLACFSDAGSALASVVELGRRVETTSPVRARLSFALHWGTSYRTTVGDRAGRDVHGVFGLEALRREVPVLQDWAAGTGGSSLVLMTEDFLRQLPPAQQATASSLGRRTLRGMDREVEVYYWPVAT